MDIRLRLLGPVLLAAALAACADFPPPADHGTGNALLVTRVELYGVRAGGQLRLSSAGDLSTGIGVTVYGGEPAVLRLEHRDTGREIEPSRVRDGYLFYVNVPPGVYRPVSVRVGSDEPIRVEGSDLELEAVSGRARWAGAFRLTIGGGIVDVEPVPAEEEASRRQEVGELLARQAAAWALEPGPAARGGP